MERTTKGDIKEIADLLDCGFRAYLNMQDGLILFIPDNINSYDMDLEEWEEELERLEQYFSDYKEIEKWTSNDAFEIMSDFSNQLNDPKLQARLFYALNNKKPFRAFKFIIDNSDDYRQQWFDFKNKWQQDFVAKQITEITSSE